MRFVGESVWIGTVPGLGAGPRWWALGPRTALRAARERRTGERVRWRHVPTRANGQAAVGCYAWDE